MRHDRLLPDTLRRSAATRPASFDAGALTVEAVVATASPVPRRDPRGAVFHATRGNIGEPDAVTVAALAAGRKAMRGARLTFRSFEIDTGGAAFFSGAPDTLACLCRSRGRRRTESVKPPPEV
jgi:hypothetical protein